MLPDDTIYTFKLPSTVNELTHVRVTQEIRDARRLNIVGEYGKLAGDEWTPGEKMHAFGANIRREERVDLIEAANAAGRPSTLADHDIRSDDVAVWLAEDPAARQSRIEGRRPAEEPAEEGVDE